MILLKTLLVKVPLLAISWINYKMPDDMAINQNVLIAKLKINILNHIDATIHSWVKFDDYSLPPSPIIVFTMGMIISLIIIELILAKNSKLIKTESELLLLKNHEILTQNIKLQQTLKIVEESVEKKIRAFQVLAHDLRSPIAGIVGLSAFLLEENKLSFTDMEVIGLIHSTGSDSLLLMDKLLDEDLPKREQDKELVDLHFFLSYCIAQLQPKADKKKQQLLLEDSPAIALTLNRANIWRVIHNLITNAIKFSPSESKIAISVREEEQKVIIAVKDQGIGIPPELAAELFGGGLHLQREGTAGEKSFGLGLSLAKEIVEDHHGTLSFSHNIDIGTTFFMELPRI